MTVATVTVSVFLTTLTLDATRNFTDSRTLIGGVAAALFPTCKTGTVEVALPSGQSYCVDQYEAQAGKACPHQDPLALIETADNLAAPDCQPVSEAGGLPWRFVTYEQATQLCARHGGELISSEVWYQAALGTSDSVDTCALDTNLQQTGARSSCVSGDGIHDAVGNVWEHVLDSGGVDGELTPLPPSGYVSAVNESGMPTVTVETPQVAFNNDYVWSEASTEPRTIMRGGFYGSRSDGGIYSVHGHVVSGFASNAIGFRCMYRAAQS